MNRTRSRWMGIGFGMMVALLLVFGALAAAEITLTGGPALSGSNNWEWTGDVVTFTNPEKTLCVGFTGATPPVASVPCAINTGDNTFLCSVPLSDFTGVTGSITWEIFATTANNSCSGGNDTVLESGTFEPTAVSMLGFSASALSNYLWVIALAALVLLTGVILMNRRRVAVGKA